MTRAPAYNLAAVGFGLGGVLWCVAALLSGNAGVYVAIGMMHVALGMLFITLAQRAAPEDHRPNGPAAPSSA
jgi:hypothetical protein